MAIKGNKTWMAGLEREEAIELRRQMSEDPSIFHRRQTPQLDNPQLSPLIEILNPVIKLLI